MITKDEVNQLRYSNETSRVERTVSTGDMDKFQEAICAFSNDMSNSRLPGYLLLGVHDNGELSGLKVDDKLFVKISSIRSSGNILPIPAMTVEAFSFPDGDVLVVEVQPSLMPPVRYRGRVFIRVGPRRDIASESEERILIERRIVNMPTFDTTPCIHAGIADIDSEGFKHRFIRKAFPDIVSDSRSLQEQMAAVGMYDLEHDCPTYGALALFGKQPRKYMPGLYTQFVRFNGPDKYSEIDDERQFEGSYIDVLPKIEAFLEMSIIRQRPVPVSILREETICNYPYWAIRELLLNAYMHRDMQSNAPIRFYEFEDRIEIMNPGGLYGNARPENFPRVNDYRNPLIASTFKTLGYVNMFNRGVGEVQRQLKNNGSRPAQFNVSNITAFEAVIYKLRVKGRRSTESDLIPEVSSQGHKGIKSGIKSTPDIGISTIENRIIDYCAEPRSLKEIAQYLGVKAFQKVKSRYINNLLSLNKLVMTVPDKPTSRLQRYLAVTGK